MKRRWSSWCSYQTMGQSSKSSPRRLCMFIQIELSLMIKRSTVFRKFTYLVSQQCPNRLHWHKTIFTKE